MIDLWDEAGIIESDGVEYDSADAIVADDIVLDLNTIFGAFNLFSPISTLYLDLA